MDDARAELALPGEPGSVPQARAFVRRTLKRWGFDHVAETVALLTSELTTNAVLHARTPFVLVVERSERAVRVTVYDESPARPQTRRHGPGATTGRGLTLVEQLSDEWGTTDVGRRPKGVWFSVPV